MYTAILPFRWYGHNWVEPPAAHQRPEFFGYMRSRLAAHRAQRSEDWPEPPQS